MPWWVNCPLFVLMNMGTRPSSLPSSLWTWFITSATAAWKNQGWRSYELSCGDFSDKLSFCKAGSNLYLKCFNVRPQWSLKTWQWTICDSVHIFSSVNLITKYTSQLNRHCSRNELAAQQLHKGDGEIYCHLSVLNCVYMLIKTFFLTTTYLEDHLISGFLMF